MASRQKRQKLTEAGAELPIAGKDDGVLQHTKATAKLSSKEAQSTLFIRNLPADTTNETLADFFSQTFPIKHAVAVIDRATSTCKGFGFATFADHEDARRALEELNGSKFKDNKLSIDYAERRQREAGEEAEPKPKLIKGQKEGQPQQPQLGTKLIIRNLPWSVDTPTKLTKLFLSYGKINQAFVPKDTRGRMRGFGIVMVRGRPNAEQALEALNGKIIDGRTLAVDWAVDKETWKSAKEEDDSANEDVDDEEASEDHEDEALEGRIDSAQSEDAYESVDEDEEDITMEDAEQGSGELRKPTNNDTTLFIRNLPFNCVDEDLHEHFEDFGAVRYARVVFDPTTERPRGTGFVCFREQGDADTCLKEAPQPIIMKDKNVKKDSVSNGARSILENNLADPSGRYTINGRVLQITRAVDKSEATRLTAEGTASRNKRDKDKRRLYLLSEGTIASNSPLYETLSVADIAMRDASAKQRKKLVDSNPSLNLSLTRLAIRNIPRGVSSKDLKDLAREAVVGFATDVKANKRQPLSKEELARAADEMKEAERERKRKGTGVVKQSKIVFEGKEGAKVQEGAGRSRGYGFIEYHTHRSALMGLRWLNGRSVDPQAKDPKGKATTKDDLLDRKKRLIVEFAIENAQVVNRRKDLEIKSREKPKTDRNSREDKETVGELDKSRKGGKSSKSSKVGKSIERSKDVKMTENDKPSTDPRQEVRQRNIIIKKRIARRVGKHGK